MANGRPSLASRMTSLGESHRADELRPGFGRDSDAPACEPLWRRPLRPPDAGSFTVSAYGARWREACQAAQLTAEQVKWHNTVPFALLLVWEASCTAPLPSLGFDRSGMLLTTTSHRNRSPTLVSRTKTCAMPLGDAQKIRPRLNMLVSRIQPRMICSSALAVRRL